MKIESLTKEILLQVGKEARSKAHYVYIQETGGEVHISTNSAKPSTYCSMNSVLAWLEGDTLQEGYNVYQIPNGEYVGQYDVGEFVEHFNKRFADYF